MNCPTIQRSPPYDEFSKPTELYVIIWRVKESEILSRDRGFRPSGEGRRKMTLTEAVTLSRRLNYEYPHILHWPEPVKQNQ